MEFLLLKFVTNFLAIIVLAMAIDSRKYQLIGYFFRKEDEIAPETVAEGIRLFNTMSLTFASAINAHGYIIERSPYLLTMISLAYLCDLIFFLIITCKYDKVNSKFSDKNRTAKPRGQYERDISNNLR